MVIELNLVCHETGERETIYAADYDYIKNAMLKWLWSNPSKTFSFLKDSDNIYSDIDFFIQELSFDQDIVVVESRQYVMMKRITNTDEAIDFLVNGGMFSELDLKYKSDPSVCIAYINLGRWNGKIREFFHSSYTTDDGIHVHYMKLFENIEFIEALLSSGYSMDKWYRNLSQSMKQSERFNKALLKSSQWDGDINSFTGECVNDVDFCMSVVSCDKWNKKIKSFKSSIKQDPSFLVYLAKTCKVPANDYYFPESFLCDKEFWTTFLKQREWSGSFSNLSIRFTLKDVDFCKMAITSDRWNGSVKTIPITAITVKSLWISVIKSSRWNGDCSEFPEEMLSKTFFCCDVVKSSRWNGDWSPFHKNVLRDRVFHHTYSDYIRQTHHAFRNNNEKELTYESELVKPVYSFDTLFTKWQRDVFPKYIWEKGVIPFTL